MKRNALICLLLALTLLLAACAATEKPNTSTEIPSSVETANTAAQTTAAPEITTTAAAETEADPWAALGRRARVGTVLPDFSVTTNKGETFTLSEALQDHELVLVNLWASWCYPCNYEFPFLQKAYEKYQDRVAVIALSVEPTDTMEIIQDVASRKNLTYPMAQDENSRFYRAFNVDGIPTSLLVDRNMQVIWREVGSMESAEEFTELFDTYLGSAANDGQAVYTVSIVDQNGDPVPGVIVNFCTDSACTPVTSDEAGKAVYTAEPYAYHLQVLSVPDGYDYTGDDEQFLNADGDDVTVTVTKQG